MSGCRDRVVRYVAELAAFSDQSGRPAGVDKDGRRLGVKWATIAERMGRSRATVWRCQVEAECMGLIGVDRRPHEPSVYRFTVREGTRAAEHLRMRRERTATAARARHRGRVTDPPRQAEPEFTCPEPSCGWQGAAGPCPVAHGPPTG